MLCLGANVVVALLTGRRQEVRARFDEARRADSPLALSVIVHFELRFGAANSARPETNGRTLDAFLEEGIEILTFDREDAAEAGAARAHLRPSGKPIGPFDILTAAQARRRRATLVTSNTRELERVPGLMVADWASGR
jgi:tRNA(fMet)-specific endonuclease VapC